MLSYYGTIRDQLVADITSTLGVGGKISFGRLLKPKSPIRYASVITDVQRQGVGRQQQETWTFTIVLMIPPPDGQDAEGALFDLAGDLTMRLAPYDLSDVPTPATPYAGVASKRHVGRVRSLDLRDTVEDTSSHVAVSIEFSCLTTVLQ